MVQSFKRFKLYKKNMKYFQISISMMCVYCVCNYKQTHDQHQSRIFDIKSNSPTHHYIPYSAGWGAGWVNLNIHNPKGNFMFFFIIYSMSQLIKKIEKGRPLFGNTRNRE